MIIKQLAITNITTKGLQNGEEQFVGRLSEMHTGSPKEERYMEIIFFSMRLAMANQEYNNDHNRR